MTTEQITSLIIAIAPYLLTVLTTVGLILKIVRDFKELKRQVIDLKDMRELNEKMSRILEENYELKKKLNETLTKIDHIQRK